jgi:hypothetical protein
MRPRVYAALLDVCCVLVFVIIGRASHAKGETLAGITSTAWPFLAGLAAGWAASRAWRDPLALIPAGLGAWLGTVALGMVLRVVAGQGTAFAFICVALAFLGLFLLGWRLAWRVVPALLSASHPRLRPPDPPSRVPDPGGGTVQSRTSRTPR